MQLRYAIVDDAAFLRELIKNLMKAEGHTCVGEADDGESALSIVQATQPDFIFLDIVMPKRNGIEVARVLKELTPDVKIIGCSTMDQESLIADAKAAGFDAFVVKPFTKEDIINTVQNLFAHLEETHHG
jgi:Response regulator containing CheY-like receiver domain and AraC-type DNA-binding domain